MNLGIPLLASLVSSFILFLLINFFFVRRDCCDDGFGKRYLTFLSVYWMTAPLAWLYAIPYEQFMSAADSVSLNLWTLAIVSVWRVLLNMRVITVLYGARWWSSFFVVMCFVDTLALVILFLTPLPIFVVMGGIRLSEAESLIQGTAFLVGVLGVLTWLVWSIGLCVVGAKGKKHLEPADPVTGHENCVSRSLWILAGASLLVWVFVLPFTQPKQQLRSQVEHLLTSGEIEKSLALLSLHEPSDFPRHWEPPPHLGYHNPQPPLIDVLKVLSTTETAPWVRDAFLEQTCNTLNNSYDSEMFWQELQYRGRSDREIDRYLEVFTEIPEFVDAIGLIRFGSGSSDDTEDRADLIRNLLRKAGHDFPAGEELKPDPIPLD